jgi:hypothetical protein
LQPRGSIKAPSEVVYVDDIQLEASPRKFIGPRDGKVDVPSELAGEFSARRAEAPERRRQWIRRAFDETDEPQDEWSCDAHDEERGCEADEAAGSDVERVVRADENASRADNEGRDEEDRTVR